MVKIKSESGFTLIELLVVIAIIGILSGIVITALGGARTKAKDAKIKSELIGFRTAAQLYYLENGNKYSDLICGSINSALVNKTTRPYYDSINKANGVAPIACRANINAYAISSVMVSDPTKHFCVDNGGYAGEGTKVAQVVAGTIKCE
ncbi:MAG: hypothetical protein A2571_02985 [Candidatus Vogelbacteria bacterium RIFOXYD1_FULL_44_32]|uniref:Type II secretion system protein GspG C-terminal domain-containing protein n=1 Tax=Candidatus Vogelbacteria bacterium RIFOXYD1_FULL_44_32 TaxID=1802438 RepID=A0A1G2QE12_9BACT|nr:MAG: hypothetical protein A2571_02985 [Candidatus Vogelbacteria bacterium RIFOXYD1_FULL_44_32]